MESKRSKIPPCPGNIFPESLILDSRFNMDWNKSPNVEVIAVIAPKIIHSILDNLNPLRDKI